MTVRMSERIRSIALVVFFVCSLCPVVPKQEEIIHIVTLWMNRAGVNLRRF